MNYSRIAEWVRLEALSLGDGDRSEHLVCPVCNGGTSRERSFVITREGAALKYRCFRASCGTGGQIGGPRSNYAHSSQARRAKKPTPYTRPTCSLPDRAITWFADMFHIDTAIIDTEGWLWNAETQRVILPIRDCTGRTIGHNARYWPELDLLKLDQRGLAKSITYWNDPDNRFKHSIPRYLQTRSSPLVLVEDQPSSVRLTHTHGISSCALLGTHIAAENLYSLYDNIAPSAVVVSLDADATVTAIKLVQRLRGTVPVPIVCVPLTGDDLKEMTEDALAAYVEVIYGATDRERVHQGPHSV